MNIRDDQSKRKWINGSFCTSDGSRAIQFNIRSHLTTDFTWDNGVSKKMMCCASSLFSAGQGLSWHCLNETYQSVLISVFSIHFQPQGLSVSTSSRASLADGLISIRFPVCSCSFHRSSINSDPCYRRGNHETGGTWKQGALEEDLEDLNAVVAHLQSKYGYKIELVVGHSRGSLVGFRWISTTEIGRKVPAFINVSGRYRMSVSIYIKKSQVPFRSHQFYSTQKKILGNDLPSCASSVLFLPI